MGWKDVEHASPYFQRHLAPVRPCFFRHTQTVVADDFVLSNLDQQSGNTAVIPKNRSNEWMAGIASPEIARHKLRQEHRTPRRRRDTGSQGEVERARARDKAPAVQIEQPQAGVGVLRQHPFAGDAIDIHRYTANGIIRRRLADPPG